MVAEMDGSAVDPAHRGAGLHSDLGRWRERFAAVHGRRHLIGIVSIRNARGLTAYLAAGYPAKAIYHDRFGANLVIHKDLHVSYRPDGSSAPQRVGLDDVGGYVRALGASRWGHALVDADRYPEVEYARCVPHGRATGG